MPQMSPMNWVLFPVFMMVLVMIVLVIMDEGDSGMSGGELNLKGMKKSLKW